MTLTTAKAPPSRPRRSGRRAGLLVVAVAVLVGAGVAAVPRTASAATVDTNAWYVITSRHSAKAIDVYDFATTDGAPIVQ